MGVKSKEKVIGEEVLNRLKDLEQTNEYLRKRQKDYDSLKWDRDWYEKENEKTRKLLELQEDRVMELKQEKNKAMRELNRVTYNKIKTIAVILSIEDQNYYFKLYKGEMDKCSITWKQYAELNKKEQKAWRQYAYYYYRLYHWSLNDGKI